MVGGSVRSQRDWLQFNCGTGFSREGVGCHTAKSEVFMQASSRLKPVPLINRMHSVKLGASQLQIACISGTCGEPIAGSHPVSGLAVSPLWDRL